MATTTSKGIKAGLSSVAIFLFGLSMAELSMSPSQIYLAVGLFVLTAIVGFFAVLVDIPTADLPSDLQKLQGEVGNSTDLASLIKLFVENEAAIEKFVESLNLENLSQLLALLEKYLPELEAILEALPTTVSASDVVKAIQEAVKQTKQ